MVQRLAILGSTGSIGTQTMDIVARNPEDFRIMMISGHRNVDLLKSQSEQFKVRHVVITDPDAYVKAQRMNFSATLHFGLDQSLPLIHPGTVDLLLNAVVGQAGLLPTYQAVTSGVRLALANKESLVAGGELIMEQLRKRNGLILPVDSEHSAIFQALRGNDPRTVKRLILTASGGPFRQLTKEEIQDKKAREALKHPNWDMGQKISIDSATLVNKGLEVMEARWLFDIPPDRIDVVVHPQSIIHSMVEYMDTSVIAQMGLPDMRLPIHYALHYPQRLPLDLPSYDFTRSSELTFSPPDTEIFPGLSLAYKALEAGGTMPAVYNTVNEILVGQYLDDRIGFYDITDGIAAAMARHTNTTPTDVAELVELDRALRSRYGQE